MASSRSGKSTAVEEKEFGIPGSPTRTSFAKIREPLEVPNLLALQTRQQLSSTALSLASQADQNVLRLF